MPDVKARVLIVENDATIAANLYGFLEMRGFVPDAAYEGHDALGLLGTNRYDALILDIGLPGLDGYGVLRALRQEGQAAIPVLMLTARDQLDAKLAAFALGADDYLVKPFALAEVEARLRAMLRRSAGGGNAVVLEFGGVRYDPSSQSVTVDGQAVVLARKSLHILGLLLRDAGRVVGHQELEQALWPDGPPSPDALRGQVHLLRKKMIEAGFNGIETVHGLGWKLVPPS
ncbi:response regulator transcription factor [Eoetvoesiella caeni]|uniref:DNA-binding response OmpR family regulator n=1 Tax=Eoetvoesiella caeni TaxID=645616 RepID=A0A366H7F0_9BURK|nr:response regulator transcription factor [Eoetvoesiella caeni]MCI2810211.1 response regulator transcription factor [Eoetvoesiella caeni]NYT56528.1 response regulator transcription factor [Eoetvoesiella caeni]RBP37964.1 DNA-binding response OmpR family regulator [Eoetvoesiella caeni]